ncbi:MAG: AmmeMemoRadiSam system protein A [Firmicutes bacterium]|nr:AmmeMemoRadiSam system protein A [Bacillota bacterium]
MPILGAFVVPHPPLIIPDVGRGGEKQIEKTTRAYEKVADEIAALRPEVIIISSPHSVMYSDYFHISPGASAEGDFSMFRAKNVRFEETYDEPLVQEICRLADADHFPAGTEGQRRGDQKLDHGTMIPLYFIRQKNTDFKIVRIGLSGLPLSDHFTLGQMIAKAVNALGRRAVYVASGDLSHKLQSYGPYGFAPEGPEYDSRLMEVFASAADAGSPSSPTDLKALLDFDEHFLNEAAECGHRSFVIMAGALDGMDLDVKILSHEDVTGVGYGIVTLLPKNVDGTQDPYVRLARASLESWILHRKKLSIPDWVPDEMRHQAAGAFVSIHEYGDLRGCIGTILATTDCVAEEIIQNAISASTRDPRFYPIRASELPHLDISVDVLGAPERIDSPDQLDVKRYGVIVSYGRKRGLLLPDLSGVDTVEDQIDIARQKGGIRSTDPYTLERFEVIRHH